MGIQKIGLEISGMTCEHCATSIEKLFKGKEEITEVKVNYQNGKGEFTFNPDKISKEEISNTINKTKNYKVIS